MQEEIESYTATPVGVGLDVPYWLRRMEMEVNRVQATQTKVALLAENFFRIPRRPLKHDELQRQLAQLGGDGSNEIESLLIYEPTDNAH